MNYELLATIAVGAAFCEVLKLREIFHQAKKEEFDRIVGSKFYYVLVLLQIGITVAIVYFIKQKDFVFTDHALEVLILGGALPALFKQMVSARSSKELTLGDAESNSKRGIRDIYFFPSSTGRK